MLANAVRNRQGALFGLATSVALHGAAYLALRWLGTAPALDIEVVLPPAVEFGLTDAPTGAPPPLSELAPAVVAPPAPPEPAPLPRDAPANGRDLQKPPDAGLPAPDASSPPDAASSDAAPADAGAPLAVPDASPVQDASAPAATGPTDAGALAALGTPDGGAPLLAAYAPPGAQLALRLHMGSLRASALADDVRRLLAAIPDWQLMLDGSGIDPLNDLERVFLASPNLQRTSLVVAGQYVGDARIVERAVQSLARSAKRTARWRMRDGIAVAPWHDPDETERVVALIGPQQFAITRPDDLPRILNVARALAMRAAEAGKTASVDPMEALLALAAGEVLSVSVEGARVFVQGNLRGVPERFEATVRAPDANSGVIAVVMSGVFETAEAATEAARYWESVRRRYAGHPIVAIVGMSAPLRNAVVETADAQVTVRTEVTLTQARVILGFLRDSLGPPTTRLPRGPAPDATPDPARSTRSRTSAPLAPPSAPAGGGTLAPRRTGR